MPRSDETDLLAQASDTTNNNLPSSQNIDLAQLPAVESDDDDREADVMEDTIASPSIPETEAFSTPLSSPPEQSLVAEEASPKPDCIADSADSDDEHEKNIGGSILDAILLDTDTEKQSRSRFELPLDTTRMAFESTGDAENADIEDGSKSETNPGAIEPAVEPTAKTAEHNVSDMDLEGGEKEAEKEQIVGTSDDTSFHVPESPTNPSRVQVWVPDKSVERMRTPGASKIVSTNESSKPQTRSSSLKKQSPSPNPALDKETSPKGASKSGKKSRLTEGDNFAIEASALPFNSSDKAAKLSVRMGFSKQKARRDSPDEDSVYSDDASPEVDSDFESDSRPSKPRASQRAKIPSQKKRSGQEAGLTAASNAAKRAKGKSVIDDQRKSKQPARKSPETAKKAMARSLKVPSQRTAAAKGASNPGASPPLKIAPKLSKATPSNGLQVMIGSKTTLVKSQKDSSSDHAVVHPKLEKRFSDNCRSHLQAPSSSLNVDDDEVRSEIRKLFEQTETVFSATATAEHQEQMEDNIGSYCRQIVRNLSATARLLVGSKDGDNLSETFQQLMVCLSSNIGKSPAISWQVVHGLFSAFLTLKVFRNESLLAEIGFADLQSAAALRKYHLHLESTDPTRAKIERMRWRKYLQARLIEEGTQKQMSELANRLVHEFLNGARCFVIGKSGDQGIDRVFVDELRQCATLAIHLRARLYLSSFKYIFSWLRSGREFNPDRMKTPIDEETGTLLHLSNVRFARSPLVIVKRPKGDNEWAREACEFQEDEFEDPIVVTRAEVVCFDGRVAARR